MQNLGSLHLLLHILYSTHDKDQSLDDVAVSESETAVNFPGGSAALNFPKLTNF